MNGEPTPYPARGYYRGRRASAYEEIRTATAGGRRKWRAEFATLDRALADLPAGSSVLDAPCGTGRFLPLLRKHRLRPAGSDISLDMLRQIPLGPDSARPPLVVCDAERLPFSDRAFDYGLSVRFFNLIPEPTVARVLTELARVTAQGVLVQIRLRGGRPLIDTVLRWLRLTILPRARRALTRGGAPPTPAGERRTFTPLPRGRFRRLAEASGLRLAWVRQVGGPRSYLQPDRLKLCLLRPRRPPAGPAGA